jgi:type II secretory pathway component PulF
MSNSIESLSHPRSFSRKPLLIVAAHAFLWGIWLWGLLAFAPRYESMYRKMNLRLPIFSEFVLSLTHGFIPAGLLLVFLIVALDSAVYYRLRRSVTEKLWSGLMTFVPVTAILMTCAAVCLPALKIVEALSK